MLSGIRRKVKSLGRSTVEHMVCQATCNEPWNVNASYMLDICVYTHRGGDPVQYTQLLHQLHHRVTDHRQPRHVFKGLILLEFILLHGDPRFINDFRIYKRDIHMLTAYRYITGGDEVAGHIRIKAKNVLDLMLDNSKLKSERENARNSIRNIYGPYSSAGSHAYIPNNTSNGSTGSYNNNGTSTSVPSYHRRGSLHTESGDVKQTHRDVGYTDPFGQIGRDGAQYDMPPPSASMDEQTLAGQGWVEGALLDDTKRDISPQPDGSILQPLHVYHGTKPSTKNTGGDKNGQLLVPLSTLPATTSHSGNNRVTKPSTNQVSTNQVSTGGRRTAHRATGSGQQANNTNNNANNKATTTTTGLEQTLSSNNSISGSTASNSNSNKPKIYANSNPGPGASTIDKSKTRVVVHDPSVVSQGGSNEEYHEGQAGLRVNISPVQDAWDNDADWIIHPGIRSPNNGVFKGVQQHTPLQTPHDTNSIASTTQSPHTQSTNAAITVSQNTVTQSYSPHTQSIANDDMTMDQHAYHFPGQPFAGNRDPVPPINMVPPPSQQQANNTGLYSGSMTNTSYIPQSSQQNTTRPRANTTTARPLGSGPSPQQQQYTSPQVTLRHVTPPPEHTNTYDKIPFGGVPALGPSMPLPPQQQQQQPDQSVVASSSTMTRRASGVEWDILPTNVNDPFTAVSTTTGSGSGGMSPTPSQNRGRRGSIAIDPFEDADFDIFHESNTQNIGYNSGNRSYIDDRQESAKSSLHEHGMDHFSRLSMSSIPSQQHPQSAASTSTAMANIETPFDAFEGLVPHPSFQNTTSMYPTAMFVNAPQHNQQSHLQQPQSIVIVSVPYQQQSQPHQQQQRPQSTYSSQTQYNPVVQHPQHHNNVHLSRRTSIDTIPLPLDM